MIRREVTKALNQFKRIHDAQIQHKVTINSDVLCRLRRHQIKQSSDEELRTLSHKLINDINRAQKALSSPHKGLNQFVEALGNLINHE